MGKSPGIVHIQNFDLNEPFQDNAKINVLMNAKYRAKN